MRTCERRNPLKIKCSSSNEIIDVLAANYGRTSRTICPPKRVRTTNCKSSNSLQKVRGKCQGQRSCEVPATNSFFGGDPCPYQYKYLEVRYVCRRDSGTRTNMSRPVDIIAKPMDSAIHSVMTSGLKPAEWCFQIPEYLVNYQWFHHSYKSGLDQQADYFIDNGPQIVRPFIWNFQFMRGQLEFD